MKAITQNKNIIRIILGTAVVLLVPLVAMQFTSEVNWDVTDFITIGFLLIGAGLLFQLVATKVKPKHRTAIALVVAALVILVWAELAVGLFGSPFAGS